MKKPKKLKKQFAPEKGRVKPVRRKVYAKPYLSSIYDGRQEEIAEAFRAGGAKGVMELLQLQRTQAYRLLARFALIRQRDSERNQKVEKACKQENLEYLKKVWGWDGSDSLVLFKFSVREKGCLFRAGKKCYILPKTIRRYVLPQGSVCRYLLANGLKWWVIGEKKIPVKSTHGKHCLCVAVD